MEISIQKLKKSDEEALYLFEKENKLFFEKMVPSRGEDYYNVEIFKKDIMNYC